MGAASGSNMDNYNGRLLSGKCQIRSEAVLTSLTHSLRTYETTSEGQIGIGRLQYVADLDYAWECSHQIRTYNSHTGLALGKCPWLPFRRVGAISSDRHGTRDFRSCRKRDPVARVTYLVDRAIFSTTVSTLVAEHQLDSMRIWSWILLRDQTCFTDRSSSDDRFIIEPRLR